MNINEATHRKVDRMICRTGAGAGRKSVLPDCARHDSRLTKERLLKTAIATTAIMLLLGLSTLTAHSADKPPVQADASEKPARLPMVSDAWARATVPGQSVGAAYMKIDSSYRATLAGIESDVSRSAEVHTMRHQNGVMQMRAQKQFEVPAGQRVELAPGGTHLMLLGLKKPLKAGETIQLNMTFVDGAGATTVVPVSVPVRPFGQ
jgi:copper(I)-binding protein